MNTPPRASPDDVRSPAAGPPLPCLLQKELFVLSGGVYLAVLLTRPPQSLPTSDTLPSAPPAAAGRSVGW
jgi:hypothetical protein